MPQAYQMTSQPNIPIQQPLVSNNPIINPLRDMTAGNVFQTQQTAAERARMLAKKGEIEFQKQTQQWKEKEERDKGKKVGEILDNKFRQTYEQPIQVALQSPVKSVLVRKSSEGEMVKPAYEEENNEQPNRYKEDSRERPETIKLSDRERYLNKEHFERFVTL